MINTQSIKFTTKLFTGILSILILSMISIIAVTNVLVKDGLESLGRDALENVNNSVFISLETQNSLLLEKLAGDMTILEGELTATAPLTLTQATCWTVPSPTRHQKRSSRSASRDLCSAGPS